MGKSAEDNDRYILFYLNAAQRLLYQFNPRQAFVQAGRATGKTDGIIAPRMVRVFESMPRGVSAFLGKSLRQLYGQTVPTTICAIERRTPYREGVHFFRGQPPAKMNFDRPLVVPREWANILSFYNGHIFHCISLEVKGSANGQNLCSVIGDEARYYNGDKVREEVFPAIRGIQFDHPAYSDKNPFFKSYMLVSDAPVTAKQAWLQEFEKMQTVKINKEIVKMLIDFQVGLANGYNLADEDVSPRFLKRLKFLQSRSIAFFNFSTLENIDILGERYLKDMEMNLSDFVFRTSILNMRVNKTEGCYYFFFDPDGVHGYLPSESSQMTVLESNMTTVYKNVFDPKRGYNIDIAYEAPDLEKLSKRIPITKEEKALGLVSDNFEPLDCRMDTDVRPDLPLRISFDWNKGICSVVTGQIYPVSGIDCINTLSAFHVKDKGKRLRALCRQWCDYYEPQRRRNNHVIHYFDATARQGGNYADENFEATRFYNIVYEELTQRGWSVQNVNIGQPMPHYLKFQWMEDFLTGKTRLHLRMNTENCNDLVVAMRATQKIIGKHGVMKNKSGEKRNSETGELVLQAIASEKGGDKQESVQDVKQYRTDITDAFDTLVIGCHKRDFIFSNVGLPLIG